MPSNSVGVAFRQGSEVLRCPPLDMLNCTFSLEEEEEEINKHDERYPGQCAACVCQLPARTTAPPRLHRMRGLIGWLPSIPVSERNKPSSGIQASLFTTKTNMGISIDCDVFWRMEMLEPSLHGEKVIHGLLLYGLSKMHETFSSISSSGPVCRKAVAGH